ncbi:MAG: SGNH/GDSL hydrolase family protein [Thermodesulfobacteriota bacterium]
MVDQETSKPAEVQPPIQKKTRLRNAGKNLLLVFLSLVLALGLVEIALRIYNPLGFSIKGYKIILPSNKQEVIHHSSCSKLDRIVYLHRNSLGMRGDEPPGDWDRWLSIVAVGGSTTICFELADNKTWVHVLGEKLKNNFQRLWISNAGLAGHSTFGHIILMENFVVQLRPKVAIFLVGVNDIGVDDIKRVDKNLNKGLRWESFRSLERFAGALADQSEVAAAVLNLKRYYFPKVTWAPPQREVNLNTEPLLDMPEETKTALYQQHAAKYPRPYEMRLQALVQICRANHILPVLMTQPALYGPGRDDVTGVDLSQIKVWEGINGGFYWSILELYNEVTRKVAREEKVLLIDLARELPKSSKYYYDFIHYDNVGAAKVASIIYQHLEPYLAQKFPQQLRTAASSGGK